MSEQSGTEWGTMVLPGVYMLRGNAAPVGKKVVGVDGGNVQFDIILHEIEVLERHINKLEQSNLEICEYLKGREIKTKAVDVALASSVDTLLCCNSDNDDDIFFEALVENESLISRKKCELGELKRLVQDSRCACQYDTVREADVEHQVSGGERETDVAENEVDCISEMSNAFFRL